MRFLTEWALSMYIFLISQQRECDIKCITGNWTCVKCCLFSLQQLYDKLIWWKKTTTNELKPFFSRLIWNGKAAGLNAASAGKHSSYTIRALSQEFKPKCCQQCVWRLMHQDPSEFKYGPMLYSIVTSVKWETMTIIVCYIKVWVIILSPSFYFLVYMNSLSAEPEIFFLLIESKALQKACPLTRVSH